MLFYRSNATDTNYSITFLQTANAVLVIFKIIIGKHKCNVSSGLILVLIKTCHINNL